MSGDAAVSRVGTSMIDLARQIVRPARRRIFPGSAAYWERRYRRGGTSGPGSAGEHREFKARFLNDFVDRHGVESVVELGCGDGSQLELGRYPHYVGYDVSETAVDACSARFASDPTKEFRTYDPAEFPAGPFAELSLSLDVILHLIEDDVFDVHLDHLFGASQRFVIIYGADVDMDPKKTAAHCRFRRFTPVIESRYPAWHLDGVTEGLAPATREGPRTDFFVYRLG